eukprot:CAMPEP_0113229358 /NCGR_PEP_ID=MMETSP0008_2-20120614/312_1 /TAXON_ID=97485 /ORGANISM="Prymnesium parvum" /LENGTH=89 /DNA_ID=CAMNT_0000075877 /DNA_START=303 /DNA_END=569 /DNA_ORIENTATION=- /assembly_acc=CAM_ASM_000153
MYATILPVHLTHVHLCPRALRRQRMCSSVPTARERGHQEVCLGVEHRRGHHDRRGLPFSPALICLAPPLLQRRADERAELEEGVHGAML